MTFIYLFFFYFYLTRRRIGIQNGTWMMINNALCPFYWSERTRDKKEEVHHLLKSWRLQRRRPWRLFKQQNIQCHTNTQTQRTSSSPPFRGSRVKGIKKPGAKRVIALIPTQSPGPRQNITLLYTPLLYSLPFFARSLYHWLIFDLRASLLCVI